jgi:hypothetical protein
MKKKLLCGILAALMLLSAVACTSGGGNTETDTNPITTATLPETETPTEQNTQGAPEMTTEEVTEPEPETEPPIEIEVPSYENIGLTELMAGTDNRLDLSYNFADYSYNQLRNDNTLVFTSNKDYVVDDTSGGNVYPTAMDVSITITNMYGSLYNTSSSG